MCWHRLRRILFQLTKIIIVRHWSSCIIGINKCWYDTVASWYNFIVRKGVIIVGRIILFTLVIKRGKTMCITIFNIFITFFFVWAVNAIQDTIAICFIWYAYLVRNTFKLIVIAKFAFIFIIPVLTVKNIITSVNEISMKIYLDPWSFCKVPVWDFPA